MQIFVALAAASNAFPADDNDEDEEAFLKEALEIRSGHMCANTANAK